MTWRDIKTKTQLSPPCQNLHFCFSILTNPMNFLLSVLQLLSGTSNYSMGFDIAKHPSSTLRPSHYLLLSPQETTVLELLLKRCHTVLCVVFLSLLVQIPQLWETPRARPPSWFKNNLGPCHNCPLPSDEKWLSVLGC